MSNNGRGYDWDAIRAAHPIADIIGQAIPLRKAGGGELKGCCPFHAEKTPSFYVVPDKEFAHCFGCGWHGDVVDFIAAYQNCDPADAIAMLTGGDTGPREVSEEEKAKRQRILAEREAAEARRRAAAIEEARREWENAGPADPHHPYLVRKQVEPHTCRQTDDGKLLLPIFDGEGEIQSIQTIDDSGNKLFKANAPTALGRMMIGINMGRTILCEGFATGATVYDAIPDQVCVTFSCGNMEKVARALHESGANIVLAADNNETALRKMLALGKELSCPVVVPEPVTLPDGSAGTDFNDMAAVVGIDAVSALFRKTLKAFAEERAIKTTPAEVEDGPIDLWAGPPIPELPRGLLPPIIEDFAFQYAEQMGTDPAGFAMSALTACAAVIRDEICIKPKRHEKWTESARIWTMLIGEPSTRKTPMMKKAVARIKAIDARLLAEGNRALAEWQEDGGAKGAGPKPPCPRLRIEDTTMESAQEVCRESPNGILVLQDELQGFFGRIEKYSGGRGGGSDRSFWLQAYGGGQYAVNRVGRGSFLIDNLSVTMLGGIQPHTIREIMQHATDDGLIQRFIPVLLRPADVDRDIELPPIAEKFDALIERLHEIEAPRNFFGVQPFQFDDAGIAIREELAARHHRIVRSIEGFNTKLSTHIGKFDGLFPRLCVIWHCVENANNPDGLPQIVPEETARRVADFLSGFIMGHSVAFYTSTIGLSDGQEYVRMVGGYILAHQLEQITLRDIDRGIRAMRHMDQQEQLRVMDHLEAFGWVERSDKRHDAKRWIVLPAVHETYAQIAENERRKRANIRATINEIGSACDD